MKNLQSLVRASISLPCLGNMDGHFGPSEAVDAGSSHDKEGPLDLARLAALLWEGPVHLWRYHLHHCLSLPWFHLAPQFSHLRAMDCFHHFLFRKDSFRIYLRSEVRFHPRQFCLLFHLPFEDKVDYIFYKFAWNRQWVYIFNCSAVGYPWSLRTRLKAVCLWCSVLLLFYLPFILLAVYALIYFDLFNI